MNSDPSRYRFDICDAPIQVARIAHELRSLDCGACSSFEGWVRNRNEGKAVSFLEYEIFHELAHAEAERIAREAIEQFDLRAVRICHRKGRLQLGECAVYVGVSAPHRAESFAGCRYIIDAIKHRLPVWKKETYADGAQEWVNCRHDPHHDLSHSSTVERGAGFDAAKFYARQTSLAEVGAEGQARLAAASVLIVGAGGLGCAAAECLTGAGVGRIGLADFDRIDWTNLHRQFLYTIEDVGQSKAAAAAARLCARNPSVQIETHARVTRANVCELLSRYALVLDCTDEMRVKYLLSDAAIAADRPLIQASIYRYEGQLFAIDARSGGGCIRCMWPNAPDASQIGSCEANGVLGTVPMLFGALQAHAAIAYLLGWPCALGRELVTLNLNTLEMQVIARQRNSACPVCRADARHLPLADDGDDDLEVAKPVDADARDFFSSYALIDVREASERAELMLDDARWIPMSRLQAQELATLDKPYLFVCSRGQRSLAAARSVRAAGRARAFSLLGGLQSLDLPTFNLVSKAVP